MLGEGYQQQGTWASRGPEHFEENTKYYCKEDEREDDRNAEPDVKLAVREKLNERST